MGLPSMSKTRRVIRLGVPLTERLCEVPETAWRVAYSGREPKAVKVMHCEVPLRQAVTVTVWPSERGPTVRDLAASPLELVVTAPDWKVMELEDVCQATDWALRGWPLLRTRAWVVQVKVEP